ncbi:GNAT family N-acetyltransferase [Naasia lichenicola]|uniref:GNAT family N-acetyltransferase n=1 Tax=Naasia lichenicola TaxID=2565933 RepID=A0A4V3WSZ8_9MICO|nr:GNAT family N-acetyltransferase [Naasia lichenicola]THG29837.1 GNAT family N-acetyltransferase [Naasia lichenicola]
MSIEYVWTTPTDERARPLIDDLARDYDERYGDNDGIPSSYELYRYPAELFSPAQGGAFLLLLEDGRTVAGGAYKRVDEVTAEVKRVWTARTDRRRGLSRTVMAALEAEALRVGYSRIELTTGARQPEAHALYLALGYVPQFDLGADFEEIGYLEFTKELQASSAT